MYLGLGLIYEGCGQNSVASSLSSHSFLGGHSDARYIGWSAGEINFSGTYSARSRRPYTRYR